MAIDSREKRASVVGINYISGPSPTPNAAQDQEWRQEVAYGYAGILAGSGAVVVITPGRRTFIIQAESREQVIYNEDRAYIIPGEVRTKYIYK